MISIIYRSTPRMIISIRDVYNEKKKSSLFLNNKFIYTGPMVVAYGRSEWVHNAIAFVRG